MLDILHDPNWQRIGGFVVLFAALVLLVALLSGLRWYLRGRNQRREIENLFSNQAPPRSSVRRVERHSIEEQAFRLLGAIYDLAEGNPKRWVAGAEAAKRAGIPFTTQDYDPLFRHLRQSGLITTENLIYNEFCKLTPRGIRVINQVESSTLPPDLTHVHTPKV